MKPHLRRTGFQKFLDYFPSIFGLRRAVATDLWLTSSSLCSLRSFPLSLLSIAEETLLALRTDTDFLIC